MHLAGADFFFILCFCYFVRIYSEHRHSQYCGCKIYMYCILYIRCNNFVILFILLSCLTRKWLCLLWLADIKLELDIWHNIWSRLSRTKTYNTPTITVNFEYIIYLHHGKHRSKHYLFNLEMNFKTSKTKHRSNFFVDLMSECENIVAYSISYK